MNKLMKLGSRTFTPRYVASVAACLLGVAAYGQATVSPDTQPFNTLAPYVLKSTNLEPRIGNEEGGTRAYRPWFESGAWTGDLIEYEITKDGVRMVRGDIGRFPRDGEDWRGTQQLWSARYAFPDYQWYSQVEELDPAWECTEEANYEAFWQGRNLYTLLPGSVRTQFLWTTLSDTQQQALDSATVANISADSELDDEPFSSPILNFIRGDRSQERCKESGSYRWRFSVLGAIINSRPVYVPAKYVPLSGGEVQTEGVVIVGANDGMLHGFSAEDGSEQFGYIPSMLLDKVGALRISPYRPSYFVDGELRHANIGTTSVPRHIVTGGLGAGGKGLFVLDVTDPVNPGISREVAGTAGAHVGGTVDSRVGHIHGRPTIARLPDGNMYVVSGNGYDSDTGTAQLMKIRLYADGTAGQPEFLTTDATADNGLSAPSLVDATGNGQADYAYAGDLQGNLWRFDFNTNTSFKLFVAGANKPITVQPDIARHPDTQEGFMVYFGTGSLLSAADAEVTSQQTVYGIWDRLAGTTTVPESQLLTQTLAAATVTWTVTSDGNLCPDLGIEENEATVRFVANPQVPDWTGTTPTLGWQVHLPRAGERLIGHPQVRAERIQFITTNPYDMANLARMGAEGSGSWMMQLDLATGAYAYEPRALFDLNKNCTLDTGDGAPSNLTIGAHTIPQGTFPVGVTLGPYNIAQPSFARVRFTPLLGSVVDGVYINALQLPPPEPPPGAGHGPIDVTTDSHFGMAHKPLPEPAKEPFDRPFPEASGPTKPFIRQAADSRGDGLGHRVDGHSFGYNAHHGVDYVDLFDLEPQRGTWRLDIGAVYNNGGTYEPIGPRFSEQELNRVTEVAIEDNQRFIVVITNADLSRENEIQIGCQRWPVYEYQTLVSTILRENAANLNAAVAALDNLGLVFTLSGDYNPIRPSSGSLQCPGDSGRSRTLRLTPTDRVGKLDALMATLPGCVNNTDRYQGGSPDSHLTRKSDHLNTDGTFKTGSTPTHLYVTAPHVSPNREGSGFRWRNGALTVQLLAVNPDNTAAFELQPNELLPRGSGIEGQDTGWGGVYARGFTHSGDTIVPLTDGSTPPAANSPVSGMMYELSMFWHWGDMTRFQQQGVGRPVTAFCYGVTGNIAPSLMYETEWFTPGAYQQLTAGFTEALQAEYLRLLEQLKSDNPDNVAAALAALAEMFAANPNLATYHRLRHYVPNSKQLEEHHLIAIDRGGLSDLAVDGTPVDVTDIERDLLPSLGPNYQPGRRSWIDLTPDN
jgi:hypothetical protein